MISSISTSALAEGVDGKAVLGGAIGGAAGAAVGSAVGGKTGAIVGAGVGGAAGAAIATSDSNPREKVVVVHDDDHHDNGRHLGHKKHRKGHGHD
ncbi:MAG: glycine zipper domain-containing protein [Desulfurivibrionaceae bacterium]